MHINVCTLVGRVSKAGPKLSYASSGTPVCSLVVEVDEQAGEQVYTTYIPVDITGRYAEQTSIEVEAGDEVMISGKLKYRSVVDQKTQQKTSKLIVSSWGIQQRVAAVTSPSGEYGQSHDDGALLTEAARPADEPKARKRPYPRAARAGGFPESN
jgi:single-stranded DNA-binding protein